MILRPDGVGSLPHPVRIKTLIINARNVAGDVKQVPWAYGFPERGARFAALRPFAGMMFNFKAKPASGGVDSGNLSQTAKYVNKVNSGPVYSRGGKD